MTRHGFLSDGVTEKETKTNARNGRKKRQKLKKENLSRTNKVGKTCRKQTDRPERPFAVAGRQAGVALESTREHTMSETVGARAPPSFPLGVNPVLSAFNRVVP